MNEWQPIETAPKDGKSVLAYQKLSGGADRILTMMWDHENRCWRSDVHSFVCFNPTHWMPLPSAPQ